MISLIRIILILALFIFPHTIFAQSQQDLENKIQEYESKISDLKKQGNTLSQQISLINSNIELTKLRIETIGFAIDKLEKEIGELVEEIGRLEVLLTKRSELMLHRIPEAYKRQKIPSLEILLLSSNISDFISRTKYINRVQEEDAQLLVQLKATQNNFGERKNTREKKKEQQEKLKKQQEDEKKKLDQQKYAKQILLEQTKNSEATYQLLLSNARNELLAIQGILAGGGQEVEVGGVEKGSKIASLIEGRSCNSSNTHLHFMITKETGGGYAPLNPFGYLKGVSYKNCSGPCCGCSDQDLFNPSGSWDWPLDPEIILNQGFGSTWATRNIDWIREIYTFHDGIDINGTSLSVKAVQQGTLYRGFYSGNCRLQYVKVKHKDSDTATFYLHVNYN